MSVQDPVFDSLALIAPRAAPGPLRRIGPAVDWALGLSSLRAAYREVRAGECEGIEWFLRRALDRLDAKAELGPSADWSRIPPGPLVLAANHPTGLADSLALCLLMERLRPGGWLLMANRMLASFPEMAGRLAPVAPEHDRGRDPMAQPGLRAAIGHLRGGGMLGLFPAGRVSGWDWGLRGFADSPWGGQCVRLAAASGASLAVVRLEPERHPAAALLPRALPKLRMMALARTMLGAQPGRLRARLAGVLDAPEAARLAHDPVAGRRVHALCLLGARGAAEVPQARPAPASAPDAAAREAAELMAAGRTMAESGALRVLLLRKPEAPSLFEELARMRALAFSASGQGVGADRDETPEDAYYDQLVLWDADRGRIAGAYRFGRADEVLASRGPGGLYLDGIFRFRPGFHDAVGPSLELSRSFVLPEYQRSPLALALLWRGLSRFVADNPRYGNLYGCVTIPRIFAPESRAVLVDYLRRSHSDSPGMRALVQARHPFRATERWSRLAGPAFAGATIEEVRQLVARIEGGRLAVPPLIRLYLRLGARFLDFHVEPSFGDALYCLLRLPVAAIPGKHLRSGLSAARSGLSAE